VRKVIALFGSLVLVVGFATPAVSATKYTTNQRTLSAFTFSATGLTNLQRAQVKAAVEANPNAEKFICTGIRFVSQPMSENIKMRKRAKAACDYAKQLNPKLSTFFQNKPTNARSYAGKVLLTIKSPDMRSVANQVNLDSEVCKLQENSFVRRPGDPVPNFLGQAEIRGRYKANATAFPFAPTVLPITGEIDVAFIYVDWADLPGTKADYDYFNYSVEMFRDFYWMASEHKLKMNIHSTNKWHRVAGSYRDFETRSQEDEAQRGEAPKKQVFYDAVVAAVDSEIDFTDIEIVLFAIPTAQSVFFGGPHEFNFDWNGYLKTAERTIYDIAAPGDFNIQRKDRGTPTWSYYVHEVGHMLGIPHQANEDENKPFVEKYVVTPLGGWDVMSEHSGGQRTMTSWLRWLAGWLEDDQVLCITKDMVTENFFELHQVNEVKGRTESLVIKLSDTKAVVVESRRFDKKFDIETGNSPNGLIAYTVDATKASAQGNQVILSPRDIRQYIKQNNTWPDWRELDAIFFQGDSVVVDGIKIEAFNIGSGSDVVRVTRASVATPASREDEDRFLVIETHAREPELTNFCGCCGCFPNPWLD
jgi:M6 family metalloprotease-like protein